MHVWIKLPDILLITQMWAHDSFILLKKTDCEEQNGTYLKREDMRNYKSQLATDSGSSGSFFAKCNSFL